MRAHVTARELASPPFEDVYVRACANPGHPGSASNMTTWVNSQFPRPDFHRQVQRHYGLHPSLSSHMFVPASLGRRLRINLELVSRYLRPAVRWRRQGLPSSRGTRMIFRHVLRPRRDQARGWVQVSLMPGTAPASDNDEGSPRSLISGLNRTAFDLAVYASR